MGDIGKIGWLVDLEYLLEIGIIREIGLEPFRLFDQGSITHAELLEWVTPICDGYRIKDWTLTKEGSIDVDGWVNLEDKELTRLPLRFGRVSKNFYCFNNYLTTLEGAPKEVGGDFSCSFNQLTTLEGAPKKVGESFYCNRNPLTSLEGIGVVGGIVFSSL
jgi:hypothetical protein